MSFRQRLALAIYSAERNSTEFYPYGIDAYLKFLARQGK